VKSSGNPTSQGGSRFVAGLTALWSQWFGPGTPQPQQTPEGFLPRQFDFPSFINTSITPRSTEQTSFQQLRNLADAYYLLRTVIETRKDQIVKLPWRLGRKPKNGALPSETRTRSENDPDVKKLTAFFQYPDRDNNWETWLRMLMEDMLVIDAATIYPWRSKGGDIIACIPMDGATIKPVVDPMGLRPQEGTAYQQIIKGQVYSELTKDQLLYKPRNMRTSRLYGFSPVEQIILIVNLGIRRAIYQINYYTEGNVPEAIAMVPDTWSPDQIKQFQTYFDAALAGDLAARRRITFVPETKGAFQFTRETTLKDEMDEYLARVVCYVMSVPPTPFVKQMNRASAEQQNKAAVQEGQEASKTWIKALMDELIQSPRFFAKANIEFQWDDEQEIDPLKRAQIDDLDIRNGKRSIDELLERDGLDPIGVGHGIVTISGFMLLEDAIKQSKKVADTPLPTPGAGNESALTDGKSKETNGELGNKKETTPAAEKLTKATVKKKVTVMTGALPESATKRMAVMSKNVARFLSKQGKKIASQAAELYSHVTKDDSDEARRISDEIDLEWSDLVKSVESSIQDTATASAAATLVQVGITDDGIFGQVNEAALKFAKDRAAELIGMKYVDGELVTNPNPAYAVTDTTREELRNIVAKAFEEGMSPAELETAIEESFQFSSARAEMIARTELKAAHIGGALEAAKGSGVVVGKRISLSNDHTGIDECDLAAALGIIGLGDDFLGDDGPPIHPNCNCSLELTYEGEAP
jgi:hypothetical protein